MKSSGSAGGPSLSPAQTEDMTCGTGNFLMERVVERSNMLNALRRVEQNRGACGVDGLELKEFRPYLNEHWPKTREELLKDTYHPMPVRRVEIPKPDGGVRMLGIPTVIDRLIQQALLQVLTPLFDPEFSESSFGFRPGRRAHDAVKKARGYISDGYRYVVDMDLEKFFDRVNHDILMSRIARKVKDKRVLRLIRRYLEAGAMEHGCCVRTEEGTPQGGPLSPLLANIMLDDLDKELEKRGARFARYADDCNVYVKSLRAGQRVYESVARFVEGKLKLKVNREKSAVDRPWRRKFLGFSFTLERRSRIRLAPKAVKRLEERVRKVTKRSRGTSLKSRIEGLNEYLAGWLGYFKLIETPSILERLDEWIRRRLRACLLKQWKRSKTKRKKLISLGISEDWARMIAGSRKGVWRLAHTPQLSKALGLSYWRGQGLFSLAENYRKSCQSL
jgi:RNA-directed DNA polymerase